MNLPEDTSTFSPSDATSKMFHKGQVKSQPYVLHNNKPKGWTKVGERKDVSKSFYMPHGLP